MLQAGSEAKLCLLDALAGSGKTTLLAQWAATAGAGRVAWVSLDEGDNDPTRLWSYISEALRGVEPSVGTAVLQALHRTSGDFGRSVPPLLLNDLNGIGSSLVLVLDDHHLLSDPGCHRMNGELAELRGADFQFSTEEAAALLNDMMGLELATVDVARLAAPTEGWAAGLYLAGLSLLGRPEPGAFITAFHGDHRHVADYLTADVLARQPGAVRTFLLRSSVLRRLSGPLCDDVLEREGSTELLRS